jgi:glycosyltransferase involved in cell wall biosynthesis
MKKLLMVSTIHPTMSNFLLPFATHFRTQGWQVDAMAYKISTSVECVEGFDHVWDVEWSRNPLDPRNLLFAPKTIREIVMREKYDIVHVHNPVAAFVTRFALKDLRHQLKTKIIYTAHGFHFHKGGNPLKNIAFVKLEKLASKWTDYIVTINQEDRAAVLKYELVAVDHARYMPGIGVNLKYNNRDTIPDSAVTKVRQELGLNESNPLLLSLAEFSPNKRHADTIGAFAKLDRTDVHLALVSTGPLLEKMQQLAAELGVASRVHFLGWRSDVPVLMKAANANILVSAREGLPRSVMESLASELPTIGTNIRGTQDLLAGGYGLLVDVGDVTGLTEAITWILDRPQEARDMAKRGREHVEAYDLNRIIQLHEELYTEAII